MDGPPPQEEDFSFMPAAERLAHKNWKDRVSAYETLVKTFQNTASDTDPAFKPYTSNPDLLKKIATDSNAVAQEKAIECLVAYVKFAGETAAKTREAVLPALVDKSYGSSRAGTKAHALELTLQYVEIENGGAGVVSDILPGLGAKQPKTVSGCVVALKEIIRTSVRSFGNQTTPPPPVLKALPKIFAHSDKTVKELKQAFENMEKEGKGKGTLKPQRLTRAQAREAEAAAENGGDGEHEQAPDAGDDAVSKLPASFSTALMSSKWKERKEVLDELHTVLNATPRIKDAPELGDVVKSLAVRVQADANINCVMTAAACLEALAKGMMASFSRFRETIVPPMLERLKERKATVTDTIGAALDAVFATATLPDIIPDLSPALAHKNPQVKEGTLKFLGRCLATSKTPVQPPQIKPLAESLASLLEDSLEGYRNEAANYGGGEAVIDPSAEVRKAKIKEAFEKATVKCKAGGGPPPKPAAAPKSTVPSKKAPPKVAPPSIKEEQLLDNVEPPKKAAKPPARLMKTKPSSSSESSSAPPSAPAPKKPPPLSNNKPAKPAAAAAPDTFKYKHTPEDAEALAVDLILASILTDLGDANWKTRLAALDEMSAWLDNIIADVDSEVVVRSLAKKGWAEKNFQVSTKIYGICAALAERSSTFGRSCVALCVPHMVAKLGDMKLKKPAGDALLLFGEKTSLQFVLNQGYEPLSKQKAPKASKDLLEDLNPQLLNTITSEFEKVEDTTPSEPTRTSADVAAAPATASQSAGGDGDALDDLFPRVEIDGLQGSNKRLTPSMGEIGQVLKARVVDTNKAVQTLALDIVARIATGMGKPFEKQTRFFVFC
ncbi:armadillo-type protein [Lentinula aff. detonsa]|uniref:Armadillo-type protein n=1 Tax=Lentinula aff. detonsa TaxID=2804958 RepID=A0AA38K7N7_9AGAR|nr:armadillo-type protein [Lentinula aff. detonsa]